MAYKDFQTGAKGENLVKELLDKAGIENSPNTSKSLKDMAEFDIKANINGKEVLLEVKNDVMAEKTKNLAIEYFNSRKNKESGITATKAHLWFVIFGIPPKVWVTKVSSLKEFISKEKPIKNVTHGGDKNASLLIYSINHISTIFFQLSDLSPNEIKSKLEELCE